MVTTDADAEPGIEAIELSEDLADVLAGVLPGSDRPTTLADVFDSPDDWLPSEAPQSVSTMYQNDVTRHAVHLEHGVAYVPCILDALIVGFLVPDDPVRIDSESPGTGAVVEYRISDSTVDVTPEDAVVSFGIAEADATGFSTGDLGTNPRFASCDHINSFSDEQAYERWAASTRAAAVMQLSVEEATVVAREIAAGPLFEADR